MHHGGKEIGNSGLSWCGNSTLIHTEERQKPNDDANNAVNNK